MSFKPTWIFHSIPQSFVASVMSKIDPMQNHSMQDAVRRVAPSITLNSREHGRMFVRSPPGRPSWSSLVDEMELPTLRSLSVPSCSSHPKHCQEVLSSMMYFHTFGTGKGRLRPVMRKVSWWTAPDPQAQGSEGLVNSGRSKRSGWRLSGESVIKSSCINKSQAVCPVFEIAH